MMEVFFFRNEMVICYAFGEHRYLAPIRSFDDGFTGHARGGHFAISESDGSIEAGHKASIQSAVRDDA